MAWHGHGHGVASVNQTRPHCVNQMGKTHSKPLAARNGRWTAWARHGHGMLCVNRPLVSLLQFTCVGEYQDYGSLECEAIFYCRILSAFVIHLPWKSSKCASHDALLSWDSVQTLYIISCVISVLRRKNVRVIFLLFSPLSRCKYNVHCTNKLSREPPTSVLTINIIKWLAQNGRISFHTHDFSCRYQGTQHSANEQTHGTVAHVFWRKY